jgi:hypothetical protein
MVSIGNDDLQQPTGKILPGLLQPLDDLIWNFNGDWHLASWVLAPSSAISTGPKGETSEHLLKRMRRN